MSPPLPEPTRNRLSIAHLMLWTLGSAVILAFYRAIELRPGDDWSASTAQRLQALLFSLMLGAEVGGVVLLVWRRIRGVGGFPTQPGHWLLVVEGVSALLVWTGQAAAHVMEGGPARDSTLWSVWQLPNCSITGIAYALLVALPGLPRVWKIAAAALSLQYLVVLIAELAVIQGPPVTWLSELAIRLHAGWLPGVATLLVALAAWFDFLAARRDFLHWTGIVTLIGTQVLTMSPLTRLF